MATRDAAISKKAARRRANILPPTSNSFLVSAKRNGRKNQDFFGSSEKGYQDSQPIVNRSG
jgi:hypothetical protein